MVGRWPSFVVHLSFAHGPGRADRMRPTPLQQINNQKDTLLALGQLICVTATTYIGSSY